jgi:5-methylcytosine-specific restriction protein B
MNAESSPRPTARFPDARVAEFFRAICESLQRRGGSATKSDVLEDVRSTLQLTEAELSKNQSGGERWRASILFNFINFQRAGFLQRGGGTWRLLDEGRAAMETMSPIEMLQAARERYEDWESSRAEEDDRVESARRYGAPGDQIGRQSIWLIGTGANASAWGRFKANGEIGIDFSKDGEQLPSLAGMSRDAIHKHLRDLSGDKNPRNDSLACFEFAREMRPGDVVIARSGMGRLMGIGRVTGDYSFVPGASSYAHVRNVEWLDTHERTMPANIRLPIKTLTEMSGYPDVVNLMLGRKDEGAVTYLESQGHDADSIAAFFSQVPYALPSQVPGAPATDQRPEQELTFESICADSFGIREKGERVMAALKLKGAVVLQGSPGTGKTYLAQRIANHYAGSAERVERVQFHPAYSYEDFVRGIRPAGIGFAAANGPLIRIAEAARRDKNRNFVLFIDEFNRGNVAKIMGEALSLIERDKRGEEHALSLGLKVDESYKFWLPANVAILATMNTADRSIAIVDYALRRRFAFIDLKPAFGDPEFSEWLTDRLSPGHGESGVERDVCRRLTRTIVDAMQGLNRRITESKAFGPGYAIGHSFFCNFDHGHGVSPNRWAARIFEEEIKPLIEEYCVEHRSLREALLAMIPSL